MYVKILFIETSVGMNLYDKKFLIYGNCMVRSFCQPLIKHWIKSFRPVLGGKEHYLIHSSFRSLSVTRLEH